MRDESNEILETQAVVTRSQAKKQAKPVKPLKVIENLGGDVTIEVGYIATTGYKLS